MTTDSTDGEREKRISMKIFVNAFGGGERVLAGIPISGGRCNARSSLAARRSVPRLQSVRRCSGGIVLAPEEERRREMVVAIRWERRTLAVPLAQVAAIATDKETQQAVEDRYYWGKGGSAF